MKALILSADGFEDSELLFPYYRLKEEGIQVDLASLRPGKIKGKHGYEVTSNRTLAEIDANEYDLLILPGGRAPATLREEPKAVEIAQAFFRQNKPVAAICHGPQTLITAGLKEMQEAGAIYEDREVVVDGNLITSREPSDLPAFMREIMRLLKRR